MIHFIVAILRYEPILKTYKKTVQEKKKKNIIKSNKNNYRNIWLLSIVESLVAFLI